MMEAARQGDCDTVKAMLARGAGVNDADDYGSTALIAASLEGHLDVVSILLNAGAAVQQAEKDGASASLNPSTFGQSRPC